MTICKRLFKYQIDNLSIVDTLLQLIGIMPKRSQSTTDSAVGVSGVDLEAMVQTACEKAVQVLKQEFIKMSCKFSDRLKSLEKRLIAIEQTSADHAAALNDFSSRLMEVQCTMDSVVADGGEGRHVQEVFRN